MNIEFTKKDKIIDIIFIIIGSLLGSIGVNMFLIHAKLLSGGVTGIALILQYTFKIQAGYIVFLLNIPLFIISLKQFNKQFTIYSLIGTCTFSIGLILTHSVSNILNINDNLLYCLYGGIINGIGFGLVFAHQGSTGGFDIIAMLIKKKYSNLNIGKISFGINLIIIGISIFIFGLPSALYTLIAMYLTSIVLDKVVQGLNKSKSIIIITEKEKEVEEYILKNLERGVTILYGEGAYTEQPKKIIFCIVPLSQLPELKKIVSSIDSKAFMSISDASEIIGKGFKKTI